MFCNGEGIQVGIVWYIVIGIYVDMLSSVVGCDSIVFIMIIVGVIEVMIDFLFVDIEKGESVVLLVSVLGMDFYILEWFLLEGLLCIDCFDLLL